MMMRVAVAMLLIISQSIHAGTGTLFNVTATGTPGNVSIILCLNGVGMLSCQNYMVSALNITMTPTIPNHVYPSIGIKINTAGYTFEDCVPNPNGYCLFSASQSQPKTISLTENQATQATLTAIATPSTIELNETSTLSTSGGSGTGAVTYAVQTGSSNCSISGDTLTGIGIGTCTVVATKAADTHYPATTSSPIMVTVTQISQTIIFTSSAPTNAIVNNSTYTPTATSTSSLPVTITVDSSSISVCSISGGLVTFTTTGTCKLDANQSGNATYSAATEVQQTVIVHSTTTTTTVVYSSMNPRARNQSVTFSANVASTNGIPNAGTVAFLANNVAIPGCSAQSLTSGSATCSTSFSTPGTKTIIANYTGASGFADSSSAPFNESVVTSVVPTVPAAPQYVTATPSNGQVTVNWYPPANTGGALVSGYTVTYGTTASTTYNTSACTNTSSLSCVINSLTDGTPYTFSVVAINANGSSPKAFSSSVVPQSVLTASPSNLALSGLGSGLARTITISNNSGSDVTIESVSAPSPALPSGTTVNTSQVNACISGVVLTANGGFCTITIAPGSNSTSSCVTGIAPTPSVISVTDNNSNTTTASVVVLNYGCQYQEGYLFSINDITPITSSIGGAVVALTDQASAVVWNQNLNRIWGINDASTIAVPSPRNPQVSLSTGQLNCNGVNDGACATNNVFTIYHAGNDYAVGLCETTINGYSDWYLPSTCELGPFGSDPSLYPKNINSQTCTAGSTSIQNQLANTNIVTNFDAGNYWSSTEDSVTSGGVYAWYQALNSNNGFQAISRKDENTAIGARCSRALTL